MYFMCLIACPTGRGLVGSGLARGREPVLDHQAGDGTLVDHRDHVAQPNAGFLLAQVRTT